MPAQNVYLNRPLYVGSVFGVKSYALTTTSTTSSLPIECGEDESVMETEDVLARSTTQQTVDLESVTGECAMVIAVAMASYTSLKTLYMSTVNGSCDSSR
jgi:hypothetical protein